MEMPLQIPIYKFIHLFIVKKEKHRLGCCLTAFEALQSNVFTNYKDSFLLFAQFSWVS